MAAAREPFPFKRGATFQVAMSLPATVPIDYFEGWTASSQLRRKGNDSESGYIADLDFAWVDEGVSRQFTLKADSTDDWPLGEAELDVLWTSPDGNQSARSKTAFFTIKRGITR